MIFIIVGDRQFSGRTAGCVWMNLPEQTSEAALAIRRLIAESGGFQRREQAILRAVAMVISISVGRQRWIASAGFGCLFGGDHPDAAAVRT